MKLFVPQKIERYSAEYTSPLSPLLEELQRETISTMDDAQMLTGVVEGGVASDEVIITTI